MGKKEQNKTHAFRNDLDLYPEEEYNPDFDLDRYINRQMQGGHPRASKPIRDKGRQSFFKNAVLIALVFVVGLFWYHDWSAAETWSSIFGYDDVGVIVNPNPSGNLAIPPVPAIEIPPILSQPSTAPEDFSGYMKTMNDAGLQGAFSNEGFISLYQTDVSVHYLNALKEGGYLENLSYPAVIGIYNSGVTIDYLHQLSANDFAGKFSTTAIIALYNADVTVDYLKELRDRKQLDSMSYVEIIMAYNIDQ